MNLTKADFRVAGNDAQYGGRANLTVNQLENRVAVYECLVEYFAERGERLLVQSLIPDLERFQRALESSIEFQVKTAVNKCTH